MFPLLATWVYNTLAVLVVRVWWLVMRHSVSAFSTGYSTCQHVKYFMLASLGLCSLCLPPLVILRVAVSIGLKVTAEL